MADTVKPLGVVFYVNDIPYITMFNDAETIEVSKGQTITIAVDGITTDPWAGAENMAGLLPLSEINAPRPPKFTSEAEVEEWLDQYPTRV